MLNQGNFLYLLVMRILELSLIKRFDEKLPEIFKVKVIAQFLKALMFYASGIKEVCLLHRLSRYTFSKH